LCYLFLIKIQLYSKVTEFRVMASNLASRFQDHNWYIKIRFIASN